MMGSSQSSKKKENSFPTNSEGCTKQTSVDGCSTASSKNIDEKVTKIKNSIPQVDFSALENEDPIQRRRRIMSEDRRNCYVLKLKSLRQEQLKQKLTEEKKLSERVTLKKLINPDTQNNKAKVINCEDQITENDYVNKINNQSPHHKGNGNINDKNSKIIPTTRMNSVCDNTAEKIAVSKMDCNASEDETSVKQTKCPSLPGRLNKTFSPSLVSYDVSEVINEKSVIHKEDKLCYPIFLENSGNHERKLEPLNSSKQSIKCQMERKSKIESQNTINSEGNLNTNDKKKGFFNLFSQHNAIFDKCFNAGRTASNKNCSDLRRSQMEITPACSSTITFESDYSVNVFESDMKSEFSTESVKNVKSQSLSCTTIDTCPSASSFATLMSYKKVKKLFKKRIAETAMEECVKDRNSTKNSHYKELEELGRGHWENGVWVPSGKLTESIRHKIYRENENPF